MAPEGGTGADADSTTAARSGDDAAGPGTDPAPEDEPGRYSLIWRSLRTALASDSYLLRSYAVVGGLVAALVALAVALAFPGWVARTLSGGGTATFSRAFLLLSGLVVIVPLLAPPALAARRHRRGSATRRSDAALALSGYVFVASLYAALLASAPPDKREAPPGVLAPVIEFLYGLDPVLAVLFPVAAIGVMIGVARAV